jgi:hypothetical protein
VKKEHIDILEADKSFFTSSKSPSKLIYCNVINSNTSKSK